MVSVLKRIVRKQTGTTKDRLYQYLFKLMVISAGLAILALSFCFYVNYKYLQSVKQLLKLESLYEVLDGLNEKASDYTWYGNEADYLELLDIIRKEADTIEYLRQQNTSQEFRRNLSDISDMFLYYENCLHEIDRQKENGAKAGKLSQRLISEQYDEMARIYYNLNIEFKNLYSQLLRGIRIQEERQHKNTAVSFVLFMILLAELLVIGIKDAQRLSGRILAPIAVLTEGARNIEYSHLSKIPDTLEMDEELSLLIRVFNSMVERIKTQIQELQERVRDRERLHEQELENARMNSEMRASQLRALQMQINPHFLFNTLTMISQTAYMDHSEKTVFLIEQTADFLRYSLDFADKSVPLGKELEALGNYICIQEERFGNRIQFSFDLEESFHQICIPSLILQPLVENAVIHGVGMFQSGGKIEVRTKYGSTPEEGVIEVEDNGQGMGEETLAQVIKEMKKGTMENKIGLNNVYARLDIFFQHRMRMEVSSVKSGGTVVRITLPLEKA